MAWWKERNKVTFRTEKTSRGDLTSYVNSTGEIKPIRSVKVGAFVSGPITKLHADFNDRVTADQLLAEIDPKLPAAALESAEAALATREAEVDRVDSQLQQAINDETRANELLKQSRDFISQAELDRLKFARLGFEAQLKVAEAQILQAQAAVEKAQTDLDYTRITAPVDGIIIERKVDEGQTVASGFQTPELFTIAPQMDETMHVYASVDEADIGLIRKAMDADGVVEFSVYAYPDDVFKGRIDQIRFSSTINQNVVTYPVVVAAENPDLKLLPGMTADLSFIIENKEDILRVPNAALRYLPAAQHVHPDDRKILNGDKSDGKSDAKEAEKSEASKDASQEAKTDEGEVAGEDSDDDSTDDDNRKTKQRDRIRHVWYKDGELLRAIGLRTGLSGSRFTEVLEVVDGELGDEQELVVGVE